MGMIRGCLMMAGLMVLGFFTLTAMGVSSCSRIVNPKSWEKTVGEKPDKTRAMLRDYLDTAANERPADWGLKGGEAVAVQEFTDGSVHMTMTGKQGRLMEVVAEVKPDGDTGSRVAVAADADALAAVRGKPGAAEMHRRLRTMLEEALDRIDKRQVTGGFLVSQLLYDRAELEKQRQARRKLHLEPTLELDAAGNPRWIVRPVGTDDTGRRWGA